jgi:4-amino-4-deoxy-L-arabinose transferase-like glycosyltransferase
MPHVPIPLLLGLWCAVLFLYGIASGPLYRTESLRAIIGRECLHGNWLFPVLYGEPFLTKPPGQYVAIGLCSLPFGDVSAASARLPSVIAATASVFLIFSLVRRALNERAAVAAALLLPLSLLWLDKAPSAEIDMTLVGWVTASLVLFHCSLRPQQPPGLRALILALVCVAGGTLTKWTAPAFFYLTVIPLLAWRRELRLLLGWRHLLAASIAVGLCLAWASAVAQQVGWETLIDTVRKEATYRFAPKAAAKGYPWWDAAAYPLLVCAAHLPLALFAVRTFRPSLWQYCDDRARLLLQLLHCWTWPNLLFWSLVPNHNVRYALPMSPGLMGLAAIGFLDWRLRLSMPRYKKDRLLWGFLAVWLVAKVAFVEIVVPLRAEHHNAEPIGTALREVVPAGEPLYVFRLKDEGVTFYYARPVLRLSQLSELPLGGTAALIRPEWEEWGPGGNLEALARMSDQQGDPLIVVRKTR